MTSTSKWWSNSTIVVGLFGSLSTIIAAIISPNLENYLTHITSPLKLKYVIYKTAWNTTELNSIARKGSLLKFDDEPIQSLSTYVVRLINDENKDLTDVDMCYKFKNGGKFIISTHKVSNNNYLKEDLQNLNKTGCMASWNYSVIRANSSVNQYFLITDESDIDNISIELSSNKIELENDTPLKNSK